MLTVLDTAASETAHLQDIYTFAAYSHAAYCPHNWDGLLGNPVCQATATPHQQGGGEDTDIGVNNTTSSSSANPRLDMTLMRTGCSIYGASQTIAELTEAHDIAGNVVVNHPQRLLVVAFRGTSRAWEWMRDLQAGQEDVSSSLSSGLMMGDRRCEGCRVHRGFLAAFRNVRPLLNETLETCLRDWPTYRVVVTGHSYGGAVATLAGAYLRSVAGVEADVFTYGAPRAGNAVFAESMSAGMGSRRGSGSGGGSGSGSHRLRKGTKTRGAENGGEQAGGPVTVRVTNRQDIVTAQPPMYMWLPSGPVEYAHTTPEYWFEHGFGLLSSSAPSPPPSSSSPSSGSAAAAVARGGDGGRLLLNGLRVCRGVQHVGCSAQFYFLNLLNILQRIADHGGYHALSAPCPADEGGKRRRVEDVLPTPREVKMWQWGDKGKGSRVMRGQ